MGIPDVAGPALMRRVASQPSSTGKAQVHQDQVRVLARRLVDALLAVGGGHDLVAALLEAPREHVPRELVVLDEEDPGHVAAAPAPVPLEHGQEPFVVDGFHEVVGSAEAQAPVAVVHDRDHDDGGARELRVGSQGLEQRPAVRVRKLDLERDEVGTALPRQRGGRPRAPLVRTRNPSFAQTRSMRSRTAGSSSMTRRSGSAGAARRRSRDADPRQRRDPDRRRVAVEVLDLSRAAAR